MSYQTVGLIMLCIMCISMIGVMWWSLGSLKHTILIIGGAIFAAIWLQAGIFFLQGGTL